MKKQLLVFVLLLLCMPVFAQVNKNDNDAAMALVKENATAIGLTFEDLKNIEVSTSYEMLGTGIRMVYLQQTYKSLPVFNSMQVIAFKNGKPASVSGSRVQRIEQLVNNPAAVPAQSVSNAISAAIADQKLTLVVPVQVLSQKGTVYYFGKLGVATNDISAQLLWLPVNSKMVKLVWQVELAPVGSADHLLLRVDALSNEVIDRNNYTVYENFSEHQSGDHDLCFNKTITTDLFPKPESPEVISSASYRVIPFPAESPSHTGGAHAVVVDPWSLAPGNATSLLWHYDGTTYFDSTRGNNVWAQEDRDASNTVFGRAAISTTAQPNLTLNFTPDYAQAPTVTANQNFATTNLFYWNNILHDITYVYGFDEVSGNFQQNNQGRGGLGNDYVIADAQDAGGTNNANFSTPVDGSRPRMQMYLWTGVTPNRDGDLDNGIVAHEFGHGLSNRLTGGPGNSSCLNNAEQGGEGWSDFLALMTTTNWATATVNDGLLSRPIGTYALNQSPTGAGIRTYPYCTNMSVNPWTYGMMAGTSGGPHVIGEIWCTALWEMTWELIAIDGINPNIFNPAVTGGNSAAFKLVIEGMRLQPCNPGYVDSRNAILRADTLFFGAKYSCAIWKAFAKRGLGKFASQGSASSTTDQVADFTNNGSASLLLTQNVIEQQEGSNIIYTNRVSAGTCSGLTNFILRDTLPSNVTYVNGGTYDALNRVVSFPVNLLVGETQDYIFTVQVNPGSYFPPVSLIDEKVVGTGIPAGWSTSSTTATNWGVSSVQSTSTPNSLFSLNIITTSDQKIETSNAISLPASPPALSFQGFINAEPSWDGGIVEISVDNGVTWTDLGPNFTSGAYNGSLNSAGSNPIRGRAAFTGNSGGFIKSTINLSAFGGQNAKFRFRFGSDGSVAATGWYIDDIEMKDIAVVNMRSNLFNASNVRVGISDTITLILPCDGFSITGQPQSQTLCANANALFEVITSGTVNSYQWQQSTDGGTTFTDIPGETATGLTLTGVVTSMNGYQYQCVISGVCTENLLSGIATLTVSDPQPPVASNGFRCGAGQVEISASAGANETIDWYVTATGGSATQSNTFNFITPSISSTTVYYAETRNTVTGCVAAIRTAVVAEIRSNSSSTTPISICSSDLPYTWNNTSFTQGGIYSLTIPNAVGCDSSLTLLLDVAAVLNIYNVTGGGAYPAGGTGVPVGLSGSQPGITYQLYLDGNAVGAAVTGNGNAIGFGNQTAEGLYTVMAAPSTLCPQPMNGSVTVTVTSGPPTAFTVTGGGTYCTGGSGIIIGLSNSETGVAYQLQRSNGTINVGAIVTGSGSSLNFGAQTVADTYSVLATNTTTLATQQMLNSVLVRIAALRAPSTPGTITGPNDACPLINVQNAVYTIRQATNATSYFWSVPAGATIIGSNTDTMLVVQYTPAFVSGAISVYAINSCFSNAISSSRSLTINKRAPGTPGTISTTLSNVCAAVGNAAVVTYVIRKVTYATSYNWSVTSGMNLLSVVDDTTANVSFNAGYITGTITVSATNNCATSAVRSLTVRATAPSTPAVINGPSNVCIYIGQPTNAVYTIAAISGAASYLWTVPANTTIVSGQGTTSIEMSVAANFTGGTLTVRATAACGNSSARSLGLVKNVAKPGAITASAPACPLSTVTYSIAAVPGATSYQWSIPADGTYVSGQGTTSFTVTYQSDFVSGIVTVKSINSCSTSAVSSLVVNNSGCTAPREISPFVHANTEIPANIYPNPNRGNFSISLNNIQSKSGLMRISIVDIYGRVVQDQQFAVTKTGTLLAKVSNQQLAAGQYRIYCIDDTGVQVLKMVVLK